MVYFVNVLSACPETEEALRKLIHVYRVSMSQMKKTLLSLAFAVLIASPGCSIQKFALRSIDGILDNSMLAIMEEEDLTLAEQSIGSDLKLIDGLIKTDPENEKLLFLACEGYTSYALAFAEDSLERARLFYTRARDYGERALTLRGIPDSAFHSDAAAMRGALAKLSSEDIPYVFWTVSAWGNAVNLERDNPDALASLPIVNAMMEWVKAKDSTFYNGGPLLYYGIHYGSLPAMFGGNAELSKSYFERAIAASDGKFLMTLVYYAKTYAVQTQDEALFKELLTRVIETPLDVLPEQRLANAVAKVKARKLLAQVSELF